MSSTATAASAARGSTTGASSPGGKVAYRTYQEAAGDFLLIPVENFKAAVQLIEPDGQLLSGAAATFRLLSYALLAERPNPLSSRGAIA